MWLWLCGRVVCSAVVAAGAGGGADRTTGTVKNASASPETYARQYVKVMLQTFANGYNYP